MGLRVLVLALAVVVVLGLVTLIPSVVFHWPTWALWVLLPVDFYLGIRGGRWVGRVIGRKS